MTKGEEKIERLRAEIADSEERKRTNAKAAAKRMRDLARAQRKAKAAAQKSTVSAAQDLIALPIVPPSAPEPDLPSVQGDAQIAKPLAACGHGTAHAFSLCRVCYDYARTQLHTNKLHPSVAPEWRVSAEQAAAKVPRKKIRDGAEPTWSDAPVSIRDVLNVSTPEPVVLRSEEKKKFDFDTSDPAVAEHLAVVLVKNLQDSKKAARELKPDLPPGEQAILAYQLQNDSNVKAQVQKQMAAFGLGEDAKKKYFELLWAGAMDSTPSNERTRLQCLRLLGRGFGLGVETKKVDAPVDLPLIGLNEGLRAMGLPSDLPEIDPNAMADVEDSDEDESEEL